MSWNRTQPHQVILIGNIRLYLYNIFRMFIISFNKDSCVRLIQANFSPQDGDKSLVRHFNDLDELGKDWMFVDGDDRNDRPDIWDKLCGWNPRSPSWNSVTRNQLNVYPRYWNFWQTTFCSVFVRFQLCMKMW